MRDGQIVHPWDGVPQANLATADEYIGNFITKKVCHYILTTLVFTTQIHI